MSLAEVQSGIGAWLLGAERIPEGLDERGLNGLLVYRNNYRSALVGCLEASFPVTRSWLGDRPFRAACETHVERVVPLSWTIDSYSQGFPASLSAIYGADPEIFELCWLEWALCDAFVCSDEDPLSAQDLQQIDWDSARLCLSSSIRTHKARTNAGAILSAIAAGTSPPPATLLEGFHAFLVWRLGMEPRFRLIEALEFEALAAMINGASFGEICAGLAAGLGEEAGVKEAGSILGRWISDGLVVGIGDRQGMLKMARK